MPKRPLTLEQLYPSASARAKADAAVDRLSVFESMAEHLRAWEWTYLNAGGKVRKGIAS